MHKFQKFQIIIHNTKNYLNENGDKFVLAEDMDYEKIKIDWNYLEMKVVPQLENAYKTKTPLKFFFYFLKERISDVENMVKGDVQEQKKEMDDPFGGSDDLTFVDMDPVIKSLEECSNIIQEFSYKLNELKKK
jgi:hypothetical protein